jgi:hypothetical protein
MFFYKESVNQINGSQPEDIPVTDPYFSNVSLLLKTDGANNSTTFTDSGPNNLAISRLGNTKISTMQSKYGGSSAFFDGTDDYLAVAANNAFEFGTGDFTIESWVYLTNSSTSYQVVASIAWGTKALQIRYGDAGFGYKLQVTVQSAPASVVWSTAATQTTHRNTWVHLAFSRTSGVCRLFVDGVVQNINNGANPSTYPFTSFTDASNVTGNIGLAVGANRAGTSALFGYLDDIRITKGFARYTTNFTPPDSLPNSEQIPTIVVPLHLTSSFNSLSFPSTCIGTSSLLSVYVSAAELAGATVEIVSVGDDSDQFDQTPLSFALTGGVTSQLIDITFTPTSWGAKTANLILSASNGSVINVSMQGTAAAVPLVLTSSVNSLSFAATTVNTTRIMNVVISAGGFTSVKETVTLSDNSNQFSFSPASFELTGSGTSKTIAVTYSPTITGPVVATLTLSSSGGSIKTIGITGSAVEPYYGATSLLLKGEGINGSTSIVDSSVNTKSVTAWGNTQISTDAKVDGGSSIYFDGNSDLISIPGNSDFDFGSGNFTIEMWFAPTGTPQRDREQKGLFGTNRDSLLTYLGLVSFLTYSTSLSAYSLAFYASLNANSWNIANANVTSGFNIPTNTWSHLAIVREGNTWSAFVNGIKYVIGTYSGAIPYTTAQGFGIGSTAAKPKSIGTYPMVKEFEGFIDNFRVTKGAARYSSNFTPSTSGF